MRPMDEKFKKDRKTSGITLVELMMALIVMAIAIIGVVSVMLHSMKAKEITREFDIAKEAAATKLDRMRASKWEAGAIGPTGIPDPGPFLSDVTPASPIYQPWSIPELNHKGWTTTIPPIITYTTGKGSIFFHNTTDGTLSTTTANFNPELLDVEVRVEWWGIDGFRKYSVRSMFTR